MSLCRWSSNNYQCDLYCYEDTSGGYTTHVANSRHANLPKVSLDDVMKADGDAQQRELLKIYQQWAADLDQEMIPLGLPYDGQSFNDPDLESFLARVTMLRDAGYRVPDYVFEAIKEDMESDTH